MVFKKYLVGILAFLGLVFILTEIIRALLGKDFLLFHVDLWALDGALLPWAEFWFYMSYVLPFI